jgi:hypothetical protein
MINRCLSGVAFAAALAIVAFTLARPVPVRAASPAKVGANWGSSTYASMAYVENWAFTTNDEDVDSYVASWIQGVGESTNTSGPGYQEITASVRVWTSPWFCGWYHGYSNHWLIDGYTWIELEEHLQDSDYAGPCEI